MFLRSALIIASLLVLSPALAQDQLKEKVISSQTKEAYTKPRKLGEKLENHSNNRQKSGNCTNPCPIIGEFDTRNCLVHALPDAYHPFIWNGAFYSNSPAGNGSDCPPGSGWDTANCYFGDAPAGTEPFAYESGLYVVRSCDPSYWLPKTLNITGVLITIEKDHGLRAKDDISFKGYIRDNDGCTNETFIRGEDIEKIKDEDLNKWHYFFHSFVPSTTGLHPNQVADIILYERDNCIFNCKRTFSTVCGDIEFESKSSEYGSIVIPYADFVGPGAPTEKVVRYYNLGDAKLRVEGFHWPW